ncbi:unnamed protein product [Amoebophrya sp. A25]|nr:unnamed protein product [Amoebophrya sp. A25]|eukprot:GSA25T00024980001.1
MERVVRDAVGITLLGGYRPPVAAVAPVAAVPEVPAADGFPGIPAVPAVAGVAAQPAHIDGATLQRARKISTNLTHVFTKKIAREADEEVLAEAMNDVYQNRTIRIGGMAADGGAEYAARISDFFANGAFQEVLEVKIERSSVIAYFILINQFWVFVCVNSVYLGKIFITLLLRANYVRSQDYLLRGGLEIERRIENDYYFAERLIQRQFFPISYRDYHPLPSEVFCMAIDSYLPGWLLRTRAESWATR